MVKIAVIGGGAAGFFGAIRAAEANPAADVVLFEKSAKLLSKVRVSGGGRCNVTHSCSDVSSLLQGYPRGAKELRGSFGRFWVQDTISWYNRRGVKLKTESDGRMFPITDNSETIARCLEQAAEQAGVRVSIRSGIDAIVPEQDGRLRLHFGGGQSQAYDKVLVATGGGSKLEHFDWLAELGHHIVPPVPSLFTFHVPDKSLHALAGISVPDAEVRVNSTKLVQNGPLLITHWGLSGPAVLKLSAWGARVLAEKDYKFQLSVNWLGDTGEEDVRDELQSMRESNPKKQVWTGSLFGLPQRLWHWMCQKAGIAEEQRWADLPRKEMNRLLENLIRCQMDVNGKSTFKEEFVTAGGIDLGDVNMKTMESRKVPGLYFAGEVLDIDGITGGYNFQAAWTTGFLAGSAMGE